MIEAESGDLVLGANLEFPGSESVAFNPSISAIQAALVELIAARIDPSEIAEGWLCCADDGAVDPEPGFRALLRAVAPDAACHVARWATGR